MKKLILILVSFGFLISCQDYQRDKQQQAINEKLKSELESGARNDTIFLGIRFGMTERELLNYLHKLKKENKVYSNSSDNYEYKFDFGENSFPSQGLATFSADYYNDKLYKFSISVTSDDIISSAHLIQLKLFSLYISKYGVCLQKKSLINDSNDYVWINGNRMIELVVGLNDARIYYTDLIADKNKKILDLEQERENKELIKSDI